MGLSVKNFLDCLSYYRRAQHNVSIASPGYVFLGYIVKLGKKELVSGQERASSVSP